MDNNIILIILNISFFLCVCACVIYFPLLLLFLLFFIIPSSIDSLFSRWGWWIFCSLNTNWCSKFFLDGDGGGGVKLSLVYSRMWKIIVIIINIMMVVITESTIEFWKDFCFVFTIFFTKKKVKLEWKLLLLFCSSSSLSLKK